MENRVAQRKLAAILIADAVGFSRQMGEDDELALRVLNVRRAVIVDTIAKHRGRVFGGAGDSIIAEFPSAVGALSAGLEFQKAISAINNAAPDAERMLFRVGINLGDIIVEKRNLFGDGINVAERLQAIAKPGGICISGNVHEQVRLKFQEQFVDLGQQRLKNIPHAVRAFLVGKPSGSAERAQRWSRLVSLSPRWSRISALSLVIALLMISGAGLYFRYWSAGPETLEGPPKIAVLPFSNLSGDMNQDYFSDGITQDIIAALGRFSHLLVLANSATSKFKGKAVEPAELRKTLGARYIVVGSVRRSSDRVRVAADLTDTVTNVQLWSRQFDAELKDIFDVQDKITRDIVGTLAIKLYRIEQERASVSQTGRPDAYDYYLRGQSFLAVGERAANIEARGMFEKAIQIDPNYAAAVASIGSTYQIEAASGWTEFTDNALRKAEALGQQALRLAPELSEGHQLLAYTYLSRGQYDRAIVEAKKAIEINPSDAYSHAALGNSLMWSGDAEGSIAAIERARVFDPTLQWDSLYALGFAYYLMGRHDDAIAILEPIGRSVSENYIIYAGLAAAYAELGRTVEAERAVAEVRRRWPFFTIESFISQWRDEKSRQLFADGLAKAGLK